ncbi:hypothetical protein EVG20_g6579 [Dentipellis fragilis]|uniref:Uncharacterized protein n=1 Tax=Dentipellis fragilis TaxID=205917 RepID=A0A4Y9YLU7_9AGAM|nr:hypothetical protein EVG20_g6579 [Dentipellis fragilis]
MQYSNRSPFPPGSHGFFYFHPASTTHASDDPDGRPEKGLRVGEVRFRVTPTSDPACFAEGQDLRHTDGFPWSVSFERIATNPAARDLREILLRDNLTNMELLERERERARVRGVSASACGSRRTVSSLGQPFSVNLRLKNWCIMVASEYTAFENPFLQPGRRPYFNGTMICCLERSPLPEHADLRVLVIKVLKITDPLVPLAPLPPERAIDVPVEGALVSRGGSPHLVRVYRPGPLKLLLDAEAVAVAARASGPALPGG